MSLIIAKNPFRAALTDDTPPAAVRSYNLEEQALIFFVTSNQWVGTLNMTHVHGRMVNVKATNGSTQQTFNTFQIKSYIRDCFYNSESLIVTATLHSQAILPNHPGNANLNEPKRK